jgi:hypothetical protein
LVLTLPGFPVIIMKIASIKPVIPAKAGIHPPPLDSGLHRNDGEYWVSGGFTMMILREA